MFILDTSYKTIPFFKNYLKTELKPSLVYLFLLSLLSASIYAYAHLIYAGFNLALLKMSAIIPLILIIYADNSLINYNRFYKKLLILALSFHCLGDGMIDSHSNLLYSIPFFLVGHLFYSAIFLKDIISNHAASRASHDLQHGSKLNHLKPKIAVSKHLLAILLVMAGLIAIFMILPQVAGVLRFAVIAYILVLVMTGTLAVIHPDSFSLLTVGMLLYLLSDTMLAYHQFIQEFYLRNLVVWPLYYLGQLAIFLRLLCIHSEAPR